MKKQGFTLVELSIVLVIIGLLIGGVLVARSMIETAKSQRFIRELEQYQIAKGMLVSTFKELPGDFSRAAAMMGTPRSGDGNGKLNTRDEIHDFYYHLSLMKMIDKTLEIYICCNDYAPGQTVPESEVQGKIVWSTNDGAGLIDDTVDYWSGTGVSYTVDYAVDDPTGQNAYILGYASANPDSGLKYGIAGGVAMAIDAKLDDGKPNTGRVKGGSGYQGEIGTWNACSNITLVNDSYNTADPFGCVVIFNME